MCECWVIALNILGVPDVELVGEVEEMVLLEELSGVSLDDGPCLIMV
jgi:hypothetical protein